jgi:putative ABC transport system ATP-binding protein
MIQINGLFKSYWRNGVALPILHNVNLRVERGEFVTIMGASGSGKSTLLNIIGCLDRADAGSYLLNGEEAHGAHDEHLARLRATLIGFIFQSFNLLSRRDALANVMLPLLYQGISRSERRKRALSTLQRVGLESRSTHMPNQLSGGQQQRVAIARALVNHPQLLIADEPTGALDSRTGEQVMRLFHELHQEGHTILMVTHDPLLAETADRVIHMRDGRILA